MYRHEFERASRSARALAGPDEYRYAGMRRENAKRRGWPGGAPPENDSGPPNWAGRKSGRWPRSYCTGGFAFNQATTSRRSHNSSAWPFAWRMTRTGSGNPRDARHRRSVCRSTGGPGLPQSRRTSAVARMCSGRSHGRGGLGTRVDTKGSEELVNLVVRLAGVLVARAELAQQLDGRGEFRFEVAYLRDRRRVVASWFTGSPRRG
jgi:hypothetical protein